MQNSLEKLYLDILKLSTKKKLLDNLKVKKINKNFSIILPPPNITGSLHLGHALNIFIQDIIARYKNINGYNIQWDFASDHAGLATEHKIIKIYKDKIPNINNEKVLINTIYKWKSSNIKSFRKTIFLLSTLMNTKSNIFTFSYIFKKKIKQYFNNLLSNKYIYYGKYIINFCTECKTALSDEEIEIINVKKKLFYVKYYNINNSNFIDVCTTKPETLFFDVAILYNPSLYNIENMYKIPIIDKIIKTYKCREIDINFGTGIMKFSPMCDLNDYNLGEKYNKFEIDNDKYNFVPFNENLEIKVDNQIYKFGSKNFAEYIINKLKDNNYISKIEEIDSKMHICYKCKNEIINIPSNQFFLDIKKIITSDFIEKMNKNSKFFPESITNELNFLKNNVKNWCISRQTVWGHKIYAKVCEKCCSINNLRLKKCYNCKNEKIFQPKFTLDTWFSSGFFHILSQFNKYNTDNIKPIDLLVTGKDILFFWVTKMIMFSRIFYKKNLIKKILLHGIIMDKNHNKLSKSLGNSPNIEELINIYSSDVLRMNFMLNCSNLNSSFIFDLLQLNSTKKFLFKFISIYVFVKKEIKILNYYKNTNTKKNLEWYELYIISKILEMFDLEKKLFKELNLNFIARELYVLINEDISSFYLSIYKFKKNINLLKTIFNIITVLIYPYFPIYSSFFYKKINKTIYIDKTKNQIIFLKKILKNNSKYKNKQYSFKILENVFRYAKKLDKNKNYKLNSSKLYLLNLDISDIEILSFICKLEVICINSNEKFIDIDNIEDIIKKIKLEKESLEKEINNIIKSKFINNNYYIYNDYLEKKQILDCYIQLLK